MLAMVTDKTKQTPIIASNHLFWPMMNSQARVSHNKGILLDVVVRFHGVKREHIDLITQRLRTSLERPLRKGTRAGVSGNLKRVRFTVDRLDEAVALVYVDTPPGITVNPSKFVIAELHKLFALYVDVPLMQSVTYTVASIRHNPDKWGELSEED